MSKNLFLKDYEMGINNENLLLPKLKEFFNDDTIHKLNDYSVFDYEGENKYIELKSRNNNYNKYKTTMIGLNKLVKASTLKPDVYFFFNFLDGLYYYKYNFDDNFEIRQGGRHDRGENEINNYCYIPIDILIKVF